MTVKISNKTAVLLLKPKTEVTASQGVNIRQPTIMYNTWITDLINKSNLIKLASPVEQRKEMKKINSTIYSEWR